MKRLAIIFYLLLVGFTAAFAQIQFLVTNDMGRNGYYEQKPIAELMGRMAEENDFEAVLALGDVHHFMGECDRPLVDDQLRTHVFASRTADSLVSHTGQS